MTIEDEKFMIALKDDAMETLKLQIKKECVVEIFGMFVGFIVLVFTCGVAYYIDKLFEGRAAYAMFVLLFFAYDSLLSRIFKQRTILERIGHFSKDVSEGIYLILRDRKRQM